MTHKPAHEVELYREGDTYVVIVELPDYGKDDVRLRWRDGQLHVDAERVESDTPNRVVHRTVGIPKPVVSDEITAHFRDGVLEVRLPIVETDEKPGRTIEIE
jgi:HSP20 family protein